MNLNVIKSIGDHQLMIDPETLNFYLRKQYDQQSLPIIKTLYNSSNLGNIPVIYNYSQNVVTKKITTIEQYIDGQSLRELIDQCSYLTKNQFETFTLNILETLEKLHQINILHKDIKPENIIISEDQAYLIDFDISRQYNKNKDNDTRLFGTKGYASPEQFGFAQTTDKSDIYSLGITLNELLEITILEPEISKTYLSIINQMTAIDSDKRPSASTLISSFKLEMQQQSFNDNGITSRLKQTKYGAEVKMNIKLRYFSPIIWTGYNAAVNIFSTGFYVLISEPFLTDKEYVHFQFHIIPALIAVTLGLSIINIFINYVTVPALRSYKQNHNKLSVAIVWYFIRVGEIIVYCLLIPVIYNLICFIYNLN